MRMRQDGRWQKYKTELVWFFLKFPLNRTCWFSHVFHGELIGSILAPPARGLHSLQHHSSHSSSSSRSGDTNRSSGSRGPSSQSGRSSGSRRSGFTNRSSESRGVGTKSDRSGGSSHSSHIKRSSGSGGCALKSGQSGGSSQSSVWRRSSRSRRTTMDSGQSRRSSQSTFCWKHSSGSGCSLSADLYVTRFIGIQLGVARTMLTNSKILMWNRWCFSFPIIVGVFKVFDDVDTYP